jgi:NTE family protein
MSTSNRPSTASRKAAEVLTKGVPGQVVLVLQGGGALGAYQVGVFEALHEAGIDPDWVIGTSIGAINGALIAGNRPENRVQQLRKFWHDVESQAKVFGVTDWMGIGAVMANMHTVTRGVSTFFTPNMKALLGPRAKVGVENAAYYSTTPLRRTLEDLVDFDYLNSRKTRLTVGAVNVCTGHMRYFDSRDERINADHIMASGALPPAFPAVVIEGDPYWDGGIYSNTPIEAVLDDNPRRNSLIFAVNLWHQEGPEPESIQQVLGRQKDIQFASRTDSHIARQKELHRMRHIIQALTSHLKPAQREEVAIKELAAWGCSTTMHIAHLVAPRLDSEDASKDIDFSATGVEIRREAGYKDTQQMLARAPWAAPTDPIEGVIEHR